jgi:hypothetical protein
LAEAHASTGLPDALEVFTAHITGSVRIDS